jgi:glycine C-acetyltransferase
MPTTIWQELEARLKEAREAGARHVLIATDGVFSMDGVIANLKGVCDLADKYDALVMVDDSHAVGFVGENGRGSHEYCDVMGRVDIITGTLGKALGGASGGYTAARKEVVEWLRQRSVRICSPTPGAGDCCCLHQSAGDGGVGRRAARSPVVQRASVP